MIVKYDKFSPNRQHYGEPWAAELMFNEDSPHYQYRGWWGGKYMAIEAQPGDILVFGQEGRNYNKSIVKIFYLHEDGTLESIPDMVTAKEVFFNTIPSGIIGKILIKTALAEATNEQLEEEINRRKERDENAY